MTARKALVLSAGQIQQLQAGDTLAGVAPDSAVFLVIGTVPSELSNGRQLIAGANITIDVSVAGEATISSTGGGGGGSGNTYFPSGWM
jgi:hypothetical protein